MTERERKNSSTPQQYVWEQGWEDHNRKQLERLAILPLSDKLQWLEEAQDRSFKRGIQWNAGGMSQCGSYVAFPVKRAVDFKREISGRGTPPLYFRHPS
jgi:hypothetical protein